MRLFKRESYPIAEELSRRGLYLPSSSGLSEEEIGYICGAIKTIKREKVRK
jgi:dTDP-4-amino-4,6-dideoxygalactose transaminase